MSQAEGTGDLIGNEIVDKIIRASKTSPKNNLETNEEEIHRERFSMNKTKNSPEIRQKIINNLRLKKDLYNNKNIKK